MLVLTRKNGDKIDFTLPDGRTITIFVFGNKVRLGIEAPADVQITRPDAKVKEKQGAK